MKVIKQQHYPDIEIDDTEKDIIQLWQRGKEDINVIQIERENLAALQELSGKGEEGEFDKWKKLNDEYQVYREQVIKEDKMPEPFKHWVRLKPTPPHREGEFAEWVNNKWHRMEDGKWEQIGNMKNMHPYGETLRTSELYQMWLSTRANNAQVQVENLPNNLSQAITQDN